MPIFSIGVPAERFNLVRIRHAKAIICGGALANSMAEVPLGEAFVFNTDNESMTVPIEISRVAYTTVAELTNEDAELCGFLHLDMMLKALQESRPTLTGESCVTMFYIERQ